MRIGCSGPVGEHSGIGVVQKHLYAYLAGAGHELVFSEPRDVGISLPARMRGLATGLRPAPGPVDVYLSAVPPLPCGVRAPLLAVVHDLRWARTRSKIGATYRAWDLHRTVRHSDSLLCVSENTRRELVAFDRRAGATALVQQLGPGQIPDRAFRQSDSGLVMLIGDAPHKANELAATALARARPPWVRGVIGVGVSERARRTLSTSLPCEWFRDVSDSEMFALYRRAEYFMMLGTDEGFGLPFIEALAAGCQIIATDHPLAREVVGAAGVLVTSGSAAQIAQQLTNPPAIPATVRAEHVKRFSWRAFGEACENELIDIEMGRPAGSRLVRTHDRSTHGGRTWGEA